MGRKNTELELRIKCLQIETDLALWEERHKQDERFWRVIERILDSENVEDRKEERDDVSPGTYSR